MTEQDTPETTPQDTPAPWEPMTWGERDPRPRVAYDAHFATDPELRAKLLQWIEDHPEEAAARGVTLETPSGPWDPETTIARFMANR